MPYETLSQEELASGDAILADVESIPGITVLGHEGPDLGFLEIWISCDETIDGTDMKGLSVPVLMDLAIVMSKHEGWKASLAGSQDAVNDLTLVFTKRP